MRPGLPAASLEVRGLSATRGHLAYLLVGFRIGNLVPPSTSRFARFPSNFDSDALPLRRRARDLFLVVSVSSGRVGPGWYAAFRSRTDATVAAIWAGGYWVPPATDPQPCVNCGLFPGDSSLLMLRLTLLYGLNRMVNAVPY
jgi:hypothetical protein